MKRFLIAVALCAATAVSGAWTLQWDAGIDWPAGTTVTACLNGVCVNGITGNSQSFNEIYPPGTVLHGTAQAVPPSGYQCGDPLGPCPPSAIEEIAQTIPSNQSPPTVSAFASLAMANPTLDTANVTTSTGAAAARTFSHTVPSGTNLLIVFLQGWVVGESSPPSSITWNGTNLTRITLSSEEFWHEQHGLWYLANPTATTANIVISGGDSTIEDGGIFAAVNLSGVDTSVGTSGIRALSLSGSYSRATITLSPTTSSNDLIVSCWSQQSSTSTTGQTYGGTSGSQSVFASVGYNVDAIFLTSSTPTGTGQNVTFLETSAGNYPSGLAVSIAGATSGGGSVTISGSSGTGSPGSVSVSGAALASLVGLAGSATSGSVGAGGGVTLAGLSGASGFGALSVSGSAVKSIVGLPSTGSVGNLGAGGGASLTGPSVAGSTGLLGAGGGGALTGVSSSSGLGNISASGGAAQSISGLAGSGSAGTMGAGGGTALSGPPGASSAGLLSASGGANKSITGIFAAGAAGLVSISSDATVSLPAVFVTGYAGNVNASAGGSVNISVSGVAGTGSLGSLSLSGMATKTISGASGTGGYGLITASGGANKTISGVPASGSAGTVTLSANALLSLLGVQATPSAGVISVSGGASISLSGISSSGQVGSVIVSAGANAQITLSGASATGYVGTLALSGNGLVLLDGNQAQGLVGTIRLTEVITPGGRLLAIASEDRTIIVQIENRVMTVMADDPNLRIV